MPLDAFSRTPRGFHKVARLLSLTLAASALAACAQSSVVKSGRQFRAAEGELARKAFEKAPKTSQIRVAAERKKGAPKQAAKSKFKSYGIASFYEHDTLTASGKKFDPHKMTAAHRTLPFGTRLRVTDVTTGRSVTVLVNDRGPFVPGRIVDLSYSAAQRLGIIDRGVARVKVAVLH